MNRLQTCKRSLKYLQHFVTCNAAIAADVMCLEVRGWSHVMKRSDETYPPCRGQALGCCVCLCAKGMALGSWLGTTRLERTALFGRAVVGYGGICGLAIRHEIIKCEGKFLVKNLPWKSLISQIHTKYYKFLLNI